ncbi:IdgA domain protein [Viridothelium virens]|uniref:IdgA domain protein n=1 Tax=Viridothelium virens TaxID=1048519 RepID=A0A6A6GXV2_VIRVR|nr:IdgA domain protein [Viridothelium virens]
MKRALREERRLGGHRYLRRWQSTRSSFLKISSEVEDALSTNKPVIALESTIYTHGFPKPDNVSLAFQLESIVRQYGGVPATIGILDGQACVGLSAEELAKLTSSAGESSTLKLSRRDLSFATGMHLAGKSVNGGTTVAGTMILAHLAGIKVFATGGLGGVHRGVESSMDISADLTELGRTPVAVISSGCKSFLDIPRTLEYLETQGVGVSTFADGRGEKVDFPSFWSRDSGVTSPMTVHDENQAAAMIYAQHSLGISSGLLFGSPIPQNHEIPKSEIDIAINDAIKQARDAGASGKDNTPFILSKIWEITRGRSLAANKVLVETNVARATRVAVHLAKLAESRNSELATNLASRNENVMPPQPPLAESLTTKKLSFSSADIVVAGAVAMDYACDYQPLEDSPSPTHPQARTSNPSRITQSVGGVARNIAVAARYVGSDVLLCSASGQDLAGDAIDKSLASHGLPRNGLKRIPELLSTQDVTTESGEYRLSRKELSTMRTAQYVAVNDVNKDLNIAMADMKILEKIDPSLIKTQWIEPIQKDTKPKWVVLDTNWAPQGLATWIAAARDMGAKVAVDPVSVAKSTRLFSREALGTKTPAFFPDHSLHLLAPNTLELEEMYEAARSRGIFETDHWWKTIDTFGIPASGARAAYESVAGRVLVDRGVPQMSVQFLPLCPCIVVKLGEEGVLVTELLHAKDEKLRSADEARWIVSRGNGSNEVGGIHMRLFPATKVPLDQIKSVNGVGDTFLGTLVAGLAMKDTKVQQLIDVAQKASRLTLQSEESVSERLVELKDSL